MKIFFQNENENWGLVQNENENLGIIRDLEMKMKFRDWDWNTMKIIWVIGYTVGPGQRPHFREEYAIFALRRAIVNFCDCIRHPIIFPSYKPLIIILPSSTSS
jgi:hypothetical protein